MVRLASIGESMCRCEVVVVVSVFRELVGLGGLEFVVNLVAWFWF